MKGVFQGLFLAFAFGACAAVAAVVESPSRVLQSGQTSIVAGVYRSVEVGDLIVLDQVEALHGAVENWVADGSITLRAPTSTSARLEVGTPFILAFTYLHRDPSLPDYRIVDPKGVQMLVTPGLEPALFIDNETTRRALFGADGKVRQPTLAECLAGLGNADPQWQNYFAHELAMRPLLQDAVDAQALAKIESAMRNNDLHASARAALFTAAIAFPSAQSDWWHAAGNSVLAQMPVRLVDDTNNPFETSAALVNAVFDRFAAGGAAPDLSAVSRWVLSDVPALAESALLTIRRHDAAGEDALIARALGQTFLPHSARAFMLDHQRRLALMRAALAADRATQK